MLTRLVSTTDIDVNPIDQTLTILDEGSLLKVSRSGMVYPIDQWLHTGCPNQQHASRVSDCKSSLPDYAIGLSYSAWGELFVAAAIEGESSKTNLWNIRQGQAGPELVTSLDKVASEILVLNDGNILLRYVSY